MDFKVAGTDSGVTAIQLDVKVPGLTDKQIKEIFERAKSARMSILEKMLAVMPETRKAISTYAPKIEQIQIPVDKIGELIGPGGKNIKISSRQPARRSMSRMTVKLPSQALIRKQSKSS